MRLIEKFKRDIGKYPARASVLGVLTVVMVVLGVRAFFELQPKAVVASPVQQVQAAGKGLSAVDESEAMDRVSDSKKLWPVLREVSGINASVAFTFDANYYTPDPSRKVIVPVTPDPVEAPKVVVAAPLVDNAEAIRRVRTAAVREQSRQLIVKSTTVGNGNSPAMAIVNQQLLTVGQEISGFEITAIRAREVEFTKDGVTIAVKMADDPRGQ